MIEVRTLCEEQIGKELYQIIISNPKNTTDISKVKIRPIMLKNSIVFQVTEYKGTQVFHENYEKAKCVMLKQLDEIKEGNISEIELNAAKQNILFAYNDAKDSKEEYAKILLANEMYFKEVVEIEDILDKINNVSMQDVIDIANKVKVKQVFLLGGKVSDN